MDIVKKFSLKLFMSQLEKKDFSELKGMLLGNSDTEKYTEEYVDKLISHLKVYIASRRAGYKLIPSLDLVEVYKEHYELVCNIVGASYSEHFYDVTDKYQRYRFLDVSCIHDMACLTAKVFKRYNLKLYNSKDKALNYYSRSKQLGYDEDLRISKQN